MECRQLWLLACCGEGASGSGEVVDQERGTAAHVPHDGHDLGTRTQVQVTGNTSGTSTGDSVYSYGNSELRLGISQLSPKRGLSLGDGAGGWTHTVYTATPGIPGDSGSGFMDAGGHALGILSTVAIAPLAASNGVGDLSRELAYMRAHGGPAPSW